jgi:hypothetical protein
MQSCEFKPQENSTIKNHINVQDQLKTIEVSVLISGICIASFKGIIRFCVFTKHLSVANTKIVPKELQFRQFSLYYVVIIDLN